MSTAETSSRRQVDARLACAPVRQLRSAVAAPLFEKRDKIHVTQRLPFTLANHNNHTKPLRAQLDLNWTRTRCDEELLSLCTCSTDFARADRANPELLSIVDKRRRN